MKFFSVLFSSVSTILILLKYPVEGMDDETLLRNCSLCQTGNPPNDLTAKFFTSEISDDGQTTVTSISCQDAHENGPLLLDEEECTNYQTNVGGTICYCDKPLPVVNTNCTLCENKSSQDLQSPFLAGLPGVTCIELQIDAQREDVTKCSAYQATIGITCLCDNPVASSTACRICGSNQILDPMIVIGDSTSCGQLELEANFPGATCTDYQEKWSNRCCIDPLSLPPEDPLMNCTLCEGGTPPNDLTAKFTTTNGVFTCQQTYERGPLLLNEENCNIYQDIGRTYCSCEGELQRDLNNCTLCKDGSNLPYPTLAGNAVQDNKFITCAEIQVDAQRDDYENCRVYQVTFGVYCQCNNTQHEVSDVNDEMTTCYICQENQIFHPLNVTTKVDGADVSCGQLEYQSNLPGSLLSCNEYQSIYRNLCCSIDPETLLPPSGPPTLAPDSSSTSKMPFYESKGAKLLFTVLALEILQLVWL